MYAFRGSGSLAVQEIQNGKPAGGMILYGTPRNPGLLRYILQKLYGIDMAETKQVRSSSVKSAPVNCCQGCIQLCPPACSPVPYIAC